VPDRVYVTLSEGPESADARPFLTVDDPDVAREVAQVIARRLGLPATKVRALRALPGSGE
jgi:hypothetical protein